MLSALGPQTLFVCFSYLVVASLLFFKLGTLTNGLAETEIASRNSALSLREILNNPLYAPYKFFQYVLLKFDYQNAWTLRAISAVIGAGTVGLFYSILRQWHTRRMSILSTLLFATSAWTLHVSRLSTPDVLQFMLLGLLATGLWMLHTKRQGAVLLFGGLVSVLCLYVPGLVWFVIASIIWQRQRIVRLMREVSWQKLDAVILILLVGVAPLAYGLVIHPELITAWLGLPAQFPSPDQYLINVAGVPFHLLIQGPKNPIIWLGNAPVLDIFAGILALLGAYNFYLQRRLDRSRMFLAILLLGTVLIGFNGPVNLTLLLPFIYLLVASGITLLLQQWFTVFPRNPLAKWIAVSMLTMVVSLTVFYQLSSYFIAWPQAPATRQHFTHSSQ